MFPMPHRNPSAGVNIADSLMFDSASSQYLSRTVTTSATWTLSVWVKRARLGALQGIFEGGLRFNADDTITAFGVTTTALFRDPAAWYHIVVNSSGLYVNSTSHGVPTTSALTDPDIGRSGTDYFGGYLADLVFVDGSTVAYTAFGGISSQTGQWNPKSYTGSYGAKGFRLAFADETSTTTLGYDTSGNGNHWTLNAMTTANQYQDTPTLGYWTWNLIEPYPSGFTFSLGALKATNSTDNRGVRAPVIPASGKWYWEVSVDTVSTNMAIGVATPAKSLSATALADVNSLMYGANGNKYDSGTTAYGATYTSGDVIGVAPDFDTGAITFYKNGVSQGIAFGTLSGTGWCPHVTTHNAASSIVTANFGQRPFTYTPPSGFIALNTRNLPTPTIRRGDGYFNATTYTGTGAGQSIVNAGNSQPDLVWIKSRSNSQSNILTDSTRGAQKYLVSDLTQAEQTPVDMLSSFNSNGFTLGANAGGGVNTNTYTYVAWQWKEGTTPGFDIVTYTGDGANRTIAHNLGAEPWFIIVKDRTSGVNGWFVYHRDFGADDYHLLNTTGAGTASPLVWNNTAPTSSVFSIGTSGGVNTNTYEYVAYLFAQVSGFSKFSSYIGNGSADGPFTHLGFEPAFVMAKRVDAGGAGYDWAILDNKRNTYNTVDARLAADLANAESTGGPELDFTANGFKVRTTDGMVNTAGGTYLYAAFAEAPFKYARAR